VKDEAKRRPSQPDQIRGHTDESLALEFATRNCGLFRYVADWSRWMIFDGSMWTRDETLHVYAEARALVREDSISAPKKDQPRILSSRTIHAIVSLARTDPILAAVVDQWDDDETVIHCDGEIHQLMVEGDPRSAIPGDYLTKSTATKPDGEDCPMWREFLEVVTGGDAALIDYLQRMCGYCLTGSTREQVLFFLYGPGGNGKSTFVNTIAGVMGDYAKTAAIDTFSTSSNDRHPTDLANLQGARLVTATETAEGRRWDETRIKTLTGGDRISARFMRQDFFTYLPAFKLVVSGNHKPELKGVDEAWRRRMQIIPFTVRIPPGKRIRGYDEKLRAEWPAILMWMIEGARLWARDGLNPPPAVTEATAEYLDSEDVLGGWLEECTTLEEDAFTSRQQLFVSWAAFCKRVGEVPGTRKTFAAALNRREGLKQSKREGLRGYLGIRLRIDFELT
jgi:putative DNA primase/helicase